MQIRRVAKKQEPIVYKNSRYYFQMGQPAAQLAAVVIFHNPVISGETMLPKPSLETFRSFYGA
ncbi:hypothetical protein [Rhizobium sp. PDO1-076]|uniref:hypothetical protein n=1 Tax=Rhizobium sp. PDO1-076 TaxID=1125979 RepID=UPI0011464302|nr:hypothetical protein [Rhizobium sp. PDO1-076]